MQPARLTKPSRRYWVAGTALLVLAVGGWALRPVLLGPEVEVATVAPRALVQTVVASGRVETPLRVEIGSQVTGAVAAIPVAEGQEVRAGQVLIELDHAEAAAAVEHARATVAQADARLQQLRQLSLPVAQQALRQAETNLATMRRRYQRDERLFAQGFVGQAALDESRRSLDLAESQYASARLQAGSMSGHGSDLLLARANLDQARATLRMAQAKLGYTTIRAPLAGVLIARNTERGDVVQPGKVLMVLSPRGRTQLVVQIDEKNIALVRLGQPALASADAYPAERFGARLAYINPAIDPQRGSVEVRLDVADAPAYLRQDMTVSVELEVARRQHALAVPTEAVHDANSSAPWVLKVVDRRVQRQPVRLGINGSGSTEVVAGLRPGDQVVAAAGAGLADRARVRPVAARDRGRAGRPAGVPARARMLPGV